MNQITFRSTLLPALLAALSLTVSFVATAADEPPERSEPWRLDDQLGTDMLSLTVNHRTRYEYLSEQFRAVSIGDDDDQVVVLRTLVHGRFMPTPGITFGAEMQDSRAYVTDGTALTTTVVNAVELLRAYAEFDRDDLMGGQLRLTGGRITMDVGSRRFVARNRFRNTINGFTGIDLEWKSGATDKTIYRAFWTLPVTRLPSDQAGLRNNEIEFDEENLDRQFWGLFASSRTESGFTLDVFMLGLHEDVGTHRNLFTSGGRLLRKPARGHFDYNVEFALQWGDSRNSRASTIDLDHFAHFEHLEAGFTFDAPWRPRLALQWDYASGDKDPTDDKNGRFDTLYGARRFDFGPTGIYGPFARSNINTPGLRLQVKPREGVSAFLSYRAFWLAQSKDRWTTTGLQDPTGSSGSFLGDQIELRVRWSPLPGNLMLELGYAHLFRGEFAKNVPLPPPSAANPNPHKADGDSDYVYTQATIEF